MIDLEACVQETTHDPIAGWRALPTTDLIAAADRVRRENHGAYFDSCSIINAKSGRCGEDCAFCAQSSRHTTNAPVYPLKNVDEIVAAASDAKAAGADRFGIVTSGTRLSRTEVAQTAEAVRRIAQLGIIPCASLGLLDAVDFQVLKEAGLVRYHHNIETSPNFTPSITTTHTFADKLRVVADAVTAGLEVCSGVIIGMGESETDRLVCAVVLRELRVSSIPVNFLVPIAGTRLADREPLSVNEALRAVAFFRLINPTTVIKACAGREGLLGDFQGLACLAGANSIMIGGYLTVAGRPVSADQRFMREMQGLWAG